MIFTIFLIFVFCLLFLPVLFFLAYFNLITLGFEKLGFTAGETLLIFLAMLAGSVINIPLTKKRLVYNKKPYFFGLLWRPEIEVEGIAINVGGGIIPSVLSIYFFYQAWRSGANLYLIFTSVILMIFICKYSARIIPGKGITLPVFILPVFSALFALILMPHFAAPIAFISGSLGALIGADILNIREVKKCGGYLSIGGAGVFDGIFWVGIISVLLTQI